MPQNPQADPFAALPDAPDPFAHMGESTQASNEPETIEQDYARQGPITRGVVSFNEGFGIPKSVSKNPMEGLRGIKIAAKEGFGVIPLVKDLIHPSVLHPSLEVDSLKNIYNNLNEAQQSLVDRAYNLQHMKGASNKANGFVLGVYSAIPILGPNIVNALDRWDAGDRAGAFGSLLSIGTQLAAPHVAGKFSDLVTKIPDQIKNVPVSIRRTAQGLTGSGPESTTEPIIDAYKNKAADATAKQQEVNASQVKANKDATVNALEDATVKAKKFDADKAAKDAQHQQALADQQAAYQQKVAAQGAQHQQAVQDATAHNAEQARVTEQGKSLATELDTASAEHGEHVKALEKEVHKLGDKKFTDVRTLVGNQTVPPDDLIASVKNAEKTTLAEFPENIKEFKHILQMEDTGTPNESAEQMSKLRDDVANYFGADSYQKLAPEARAAADEAIAKQAAMRGIDVKAAQVPDELKPLTWDKAQYLKTRIETALRSPTVRPIIKQALYDVRNTLVEDAMGKMVEQSGNPDAAAAWQNARNFWRQYREDFSDATGPSGSGSPVAQVAKALDPKNIRGPVIGKQSTIGNRHLDILNRPEYANLGGGEAAVSAQRILDADRQLKALPKAKAPKPIPEAPAPIEPPAELPAPVVKSPTASPVKYTPAKTVEQPAVPTVEDLRNAKAVKLRQKSASLASMSHYDLGVLAMSALGPLIGAGWESLLAEPAFIALRKGFGRSLSKPSVRAWIAEPLPEEVRALQALPEDLKVDARNGIQKFIQQERAAGEKVQIDPRVGAFLSGNVAQASPGQQKKELEAIQKKYSNPNMPTGNEPE